MILVTGANGQIGSDLVVALQQRFGTQQVLAGWHRHQPVSSQSLTVTLDVTDVQQLQSVVKDYAVDTIYHLAGVLSAKGERRPEYCWHTNIDGLQYVLDVAKSYQIKVFWPSSIAVFGPYTPKFNTPQTTVKDPVTMYGITKATGELLCQYYAQHFGVDVRSVRFPGLISHRVLPGGGTTDFAVEIFYAALKYGHYISFIRPDTRLPMMYMPDAIRAVLALMDAPANSLTVRSSYNLAAISFSVAELVAEIQKHLPHFTCAYVPDYRQAIADSWPAVIDDTPARQDWHWQHHYDLSVMVADMFHHLKPRLHEVLPPCSPPMKRPSVTFNKLGSINQNVS